MKVSRGAEDDRVPVGQGSPDGLGASRRYALEAVRLLGFFIFNVLKTWGFKPGEGSYSTGGSLWRPPENARLTGRRLKRRGRDHDRPLVGAGHEVRVQVEPVA